MSGPPQISYTFASKPRHKLRELGMPQSGVVEEEVRMGTYREHEDIY